MEQLNTLEKRAKASLARWWFESARESVLELPDHLATAGFAMLLILLGLVVYLTFPVSCLVFGWLSRRNARREIQRMQRLKELFGPGGG